MFSNLKKFMSQTFGELIPKTRKGKIKEIKREIENQCDLLERKLDAGELKDRDEIVTAIKKINNMLYGRAINALVFTIEAGRNIFEDHEYKKIKPLLKKWKRDEGNEPKIADQELFSEFKMSLKKFSQRYPNMFTYHTDTDTITLLEYYQKDIWNPIFKEYEQKVQNIITRLENIHESVSGEYQMMIDTNFKLVGPFEFEKLIAKLFRKMGYTTNVTSKTGDFGIDVIAKRGNDIIAIQAKKYSLGNNIGNGTVQRLLGAMSYKDYNANKGIIITTSNFTVQAFEQARENPIELWNQQYLNKMITKYLIETGSKK
jgi:restriction system protein